MASGVSHGFLLGSCLILGPFLLCLTLRTTASRTFLSPLSPLSWVQRVILKQNVPSPTIMQGNPPQQSDHSIGLGPPHDSTGRPLNPVIPSLTSAPVAIVTGGAGNIGSRITEAFHRSGYAVVVHYSGGQDRAMALVARLNAVRLASAVTHGARFEGDPQAAAQSLVKAALAAFGRIDVIVNNAGVFETTDITTAAPDSWTRHMNVNGGAAFFLAQQALPSLIQNRGVIINVCDIHGDRPLLGHSIYSASKAALIMLTKALAKDLGPKGIRVNGISPGAISWIEGKHNDAMKKAILEQTALKRLGRPDNIADAVLFLAKNDYVTGQILNVDGGRSLNQ